MSEKNSSEACGSETNGTRVKSGSSALRLSVSREALGGEDPADSEARFQLLVDAVTDYAIYMLDPHGRVMTWNAGAERLKGYKEEEVLGRNFSAFFLPEDAAAGSPERELATAATLGRYAIDGWRVRKGGSKFWAQVMLTAIRGPEGELRGFAKVTRDMTIQKAAAEAIDQIRNGQLDRYRVIVENISDHVIFTLDREGRFDSWSPGSRNVLGYTPEEVLGKELGLIFTAEGLAAGQPHRESEEAARSGHCASEGWRVRQGGELVWCCGETTAIRDGVGRVSGFVCVARDMTRQKRIEESLAEYTANLEERVLDRTAHLGSARDELRRKNEEVEALACITARDLEEKRVMLNEIHHRVKNNLQVVQSLLKMSVRSLPDGDARTATMATAQRIFAMAMVHERLYGTTDVKGILAADYLSDLFANVSDTDQRLRGQVKIELVCDEILLNLDCAVPFGLLVNELLSNCLKHAFPEGRRGLVMASIRREPGGVKIIFQDDGVGLRERFDAARCTSMGLKLASSLARQLGGSLVFTSDLGCRVEAILTALQDC